MADYHEAYRVGEFVRIADATNLQDFRQDWKYHHSLQALQLAYAGKMCCVRNVGYWHGGDCLYELDIWVPDEPATTKSYPDSRRETVPGLWHEACLLDACRNEWEAALPLARDVYAVTTEMRAGEQVIVVRTHTGTECLIVRHSHAELIVKAMNEVAAKRNTYYFERRYDFKGVAHDASRAQFVPQPSAELGSQRT